MASAIAAVATSASSQIRRARACEPAHHAHQDHREADRIQNVHAQQVGPRRPGQPEQIFLQTKAVAERQNFRAAQNRLARDFVRRHALAPQLVRDQRERHARQKQEHRRRQRAAQLRPLEELRLARRWTQPRIVRVHLKHQQAGKSPQPINVSKPFGFRRRGHLVWRRFEPHQNRTRITTPEPERNQRLPFAGPSPEHRAGRNRSRVPRHIHSSGSNTSALSVFNR